MPISKCLSQSHIRTQLNSRLSDVLVHSSYKLHSVCLCVCAHARARLHVLPPQCLSVHQVYLKHFVRAGLNARRHVARVKGQLFNLSKVINWIPI